MEAALRALPPRPLCAEKITA